MLVPNPTIYWYNIMCIHIFIYIHIYIYIYIYNVTIRIIHWFTQSLIHSFIDGNVHSSIHWLALTLPLVQSLIHSTGSLVHWLMTHAFNGSLTDSSVDSFVYFIFLCISFHVKSCHFIHSFIRSFIHSFIMFYFNSLHFIPFTHFIQFGINSSNASKYVSLKKKTE